MTRYILGMAALTIKNCINKILIVSAIYDKLDKLHRAISLQNNYDYIIITGNLCYPNDDLNQVQTRINEFEKCKSEKILYNLGHYDLLLKQQISNFEIVSWLNKQPNVIFVEFVRGTSIVITNGGIISDMKKTDLYDNLETSFVSKINNTNWHELYVGQCGYVVSNNPVTKDIPQFYNFSAQIGNEYGANVYAQEADQYGLQQTILL